MSKDEMLWTASWAIGKGYDYETLHYCDNMYGKEQFTDDVWEYVVECKEIGTTAFYKKYSEYKLYQIIMGEKGLD